MPPRWALACTTPGIGALLRGDPNSVLNLLAVVLVASLHTYNVQRRRVRGAEREETGYEVAA